MSWFSKNYEKVALGGAVVVALGLSYLGWSKFSGVEEAFASQQEPAAGGNTAVANADAIPKALQSMKLDRSWTQASDGDRPVDLFTGIPLFIKSSDPEKAIDLIKGEKVHEDIDNTWWLEHRIDLGFADSPERDPDDDGFSNLEEYKAKTDPNNPKSVPALYAKLMYVKDETLTWSLRPGFGADGKFPISYAEVVGTRWVDRNKFTAGEMAEPGQVFYAKGPAAGRFKFLGHEVRKELNKKINAEMEVTIVRIEDQSENKKGDIYELPSPLVEDRRNDFAQNDRTAVFSLEAMGLEGKEFKVKERTKFALPPDAPNKDFFLKSVTPQSVVVEFTDPSGKTVTLDIGKGLMPKINE